MLEVSAGEIPHANLDAADIAHRVQSKAEHVTFLGMREGVLQSGLRRPERATQLAKDAKETQQHWRRFVHERIA